MIARAVALFTLLAPSIALGQDGGAAGMSSDDPLRAEARALFDQAVPFLEARRFGEAVDPLRRSLELFPNLPTAFNLGVALSHTGETQAAIDLFQSILDGTYGELEDAQRADTAAMLRQARADLATLRVRASGASAIRIDIDGRHVGDVVGGAELAWRLDAGEHLVVASADGFVPIEETVVLRRGQRRRITLTLGETAERSATGDPDPAIPLGPTHDPTPSDTGGLSTSAALWIGGAIALAVAAVVAIVVIASADQTADPVTDPVLPVVETLRF